MHARTFPAGLASCATAVSVLALAAAPASAAYTPDPDDTSYRPGVATDLVGVGSGTTQRVVKVVADAFNATAPAARIVSYSATGGGTLNLPDLSSIPRPVGSGAGKDLLHGATDNPNIDFARSSSAQTAAETADGLQSFPFAVDTLVMVTSGSVASHAPASLTIAQLLDIYQGTVTDWQEVGGTAGTIKPLIPQSGSGTLSFFTDQLAAANGGVAPVIVATPVTEHDPAPIMNDPNAIAPFSLAKKSTLSNPGVVSTVPGFSADRAVYHVVRGGDVDKPAILAAFGSDGFFCSATGRTLIASRGFRQLFPPSKGGACGQPTQEATTNLVTANVATTTTVTVTSAGASSVRIAATVSGSSAPAGTVAFFEGATQLAGGGVPLTSGRAVHVQAANPGTHTYRAVFTPATNTPFTPSEGTGSATVERATSSITASFPKKVKFHTRAKGTVTVTLHGSSAPATGTVTITDGVKVVGTGTLVDGKVRVTLKRLKPGRHTLSVSWAGDNTASASVATVTIRALAKPKPK